MLSISHLFEVDPTIINRFITPQYILNQRNKAREAYLSNNKPEAKVAAANVSKALNLKSKYGAGKT